MCVVPVVVVFFLSKLLSRIVLGFNLHSMLQCTLRTFLWCCVVSHHCIVPCCQCCLAVVLCHKYFLNKKKGGN